MSHYDVLSDAIIQRFHDRVDVRGEDECWPFLGTCAPYGVLNDHGTLLYCHRIAWRLHAGKAADPIHVLHECDNPPCCNPKHLFLGTQVDNNQDRQRKGRTKPGKRRKLTDDQVREIRASTETNNRLAARLGISSQHVGAIRTGKAWSSLL